MHSACRSSTRRLATRAPRLKSSLSTQPFTKNEIPQTPKRTAGDNDPERLGKTMIARVLASNTNGWKETRRNGPPAKDNSIGKVVSRTVTLNRGTAEFAEEADQLDTSHPLWDAETDEVSQDRNTFTVGSFIEIRR